MPLTNSHSDLQSKTNTQIWNVVYSSILGHRYHTFNTTVSKSIWIQDTTGLINIAPSLVVLDKLEHLVSSSQSVDSTHSMFNLLLHLIEECTKDLTDKYECFKWVYIPTHESFGFKGFFVTVCQVYPPYRKPITIFQGSWRITLNLQLLVKSFIICSFTDNGS